MAALCQAAHSIEDGGHPLLFNGETGRSQPSEDETSETGSTVDDLLYGPGVFHKLPEWMTRALDAQDDDDNSEDDFSFGWKLKGLVAGACDDGDTTTPRSEPQAELSSGSDDESGSGTKSLSVGTPDGGTLCSLGCHQGARPETCSSLVDDDEEEGLVDLDPEEGRRRGSILMAMLAEKPDGRPAADAPSSRPAAPCAARGQGANLARCGTAVPSAAAAAAAAATAQVAAASHGRAATHAMYASLVLEAACYAFGCGAVDVATSASGGFVVWLCGWAALELQRSHQAVLETLSQALWPYLSQDIVAVEQRTASSGARLSGVASAVASTRLTLWCLAEEAKHDQSFCWQYVRSGVCPRGAFCRWHHSMPPTYPIDIEVAAA